MTDNILLWLNQVHLLRPLWLLALLPALGLLLALWFRRARANQWQQAIAPHLLRHLIENDQGRASRLPLLGLLALWCIAIIALAGPAWRKLPEPVQKGGSALVILWDMSPSMMAEDLKPSRLVRSRLKLIDLLEARREGTTGLIAYAGEAHIVTPLTDDTDTIISLLPALKPANMPMRGSNPEMALQMAYRLLGDAGVADGHVLILTDGIVPEAFDALKRIQRGANHQITLWGLGTEDGAPIPLSDGGFARNSSGEIVIAKLNEDALQDFAADINAYYVPFLKTAEDIKTLQTLFSSQGETMRDSDRVFDRWYEHGPWLLVLILPLVALTFRRGWLMCLPVLVLPLSLPQPAHASVWDDLWKTPDQQAQQALEQQQPEKAAELFQDPDWRGTALYRAEDYEAALKAFSHSDSPRATYNRGNSLMHLGNYQSAIEAYEATLEKDPDNADAKANLELAKKLLQQKKQQQKKNQDGQGQNQKGDQKKDNQQKGDQQKSQQNQSGSGEQNQQQNSQKSDGGRKDNQQGQSGEGQPQNSRDSAYDDPANNTPQDEKSDIGKPGQEDKGQEDKSQQQKPSDEPGEKPASQHAPQQAEGDGQKKASEQATASTQLTEAEREQQQALEQWLRKVPDDPGGLLRNKFLHQFRERRRTGEWQTPGNEAGQRW